MPYKVIVTQGNYRTIAVSKENRTREKLLVLANELEEQNKDTYQIYILVFDDEKAAKLYSKVDMSLPVLNFLKMPARNFRF
ncbi:MAG: hypothetical protein KIG91_01395 [Treponema sp.]|nr:hypothetical protein [Treponema sp.]